MELQSVNISLSNIPKSGQSRSVVIKGQEGASFILQVVDSAGKFYDFVNNSFVNGHIPRCNFKGTISNNEFTIRIQFPSVVASTNYNVILIADPSTDTVISSNRKAINVSITQVVDTTVTLAYNTANTANYYSDPPVASLGSKGTTGKATATFVNTTATVTNATTQVGGFGLKLDRQPLDTDFVFIATTTLDGTTSSSTTLLVDGITDISVGMYLVSGPNLSGTPMVTNVEDNLDIGGVQKKRITLSTAQTLNSDGATLTFHARGSKGIYSAIGLGIEKITAVASIPKKGFVKHAVRSVGGSATAGSDATLGLDATYGIGKGAKFKCLGITAGLTVASISAGSPATGNGTIEMSSAQDLSSQDNAGVGFIVYFDNFYTQIDLKINFTITTPGSTNRTITLLLDNFITPGAAS